MKAQTIQLEINRQSTFWSERNRKYGDGARLEVRGRQRCLHNKLGLRVLMRACLRKVIKGRGSEQIARIITTLAPTIKVTINLIYNAYYKYDMIFTSGSK